MWRIRAALSAAVSPFPLPLPLPLPPPTGCLREFDNAEASKRDCSLDATSFLSKSVGTAFLLGSVKRRAFSAALPPTTTPVAAVVVDRREVACLEGGGAWN